MITFIIFFLNKMKTFLLKKRSFFFKVLFLDFFLKEGKDTFLERKKKEKKIWKGFERAFSKKR